MRKSSGLAAVMAFSALIASAAAQEIDIDEEALREACPVSQFDPSSFPCQVRSLLAEVQTLRTQAERVRETDAETTERLTGHFCDLAKLQLDLAEALLEIAVLRDDVDGARRHGGEIPRLVRWRHGRCGE